MAGPTVRATSSAGSTTAVGTLTVPAAASVGGDLLVLMGFTRGAVNTMVAPFGQTPLDVTVGSGTGSRVRVWTKLAKAVEDDITITLGLSTQACGALLVAFTKGSATGFAYDSDPTWVETSSTTSGPIHSENSTADNNLVLAFVSEIAGNTTGPAWTTPSGWTSQVQQYAHDGTKGLRAGLFTIPQSAAGATPTATVLSTVLSGWLTTVLPLTSTVFITGTDGAGDGSSGNLAGSAPIMGAETTVEGSAGTLMSATPISGDDRVQIVDAGVPQSGTPIGGSDLLAELSAMTTFTAPAGPATAEWISDGIAQAEWFTDGLSTADFTTSDGISLAGFTPGGDRTGGGGDPGTGGDSGGGTLPPDPPAHVAGGWLSFV